MKLNLGSLIKAAIFGSVIHIVVDVFTISLGIISVLASLAVSVLVGVLYVRFHRKKELISTSVGAVGSGLAGLLAALAAGAFGAGMGLFYGSLYASNNGATVFGIVDNICNGGVVILNGVLAAIAGAFEAWSTHPHSHRF